MKGRKLVAIMLASSIMISGESVSVKAAGVSETKAEPVQNERSLEENAEDVTVEKLTKVTKMVKSKVTIPEEYTEFTYECYGGMEAGQLRYDLKWDDKAGGSTIQVGCDDRGNISYYNYYKADQKNNFKPKYKRDQLQENADRFLKKAMPVSTGRVQLTDNNFRNIYSSSYIYTYERIENGIPLPENTVEIEINYETGKVISLQSIWEYDLSFPTAKVSVSEKEAKEKLKDKLEMDLDYYLAYNTGKNEELGKEKIFLAYTPNISTLAIDAISGKLYTSKGGKDSQFDPMPQAEMEDTKMSKDTGAEAGAFPSLTKEEIKKIDEIADIISSEKAISIIKNNTSLYLDKNATKTTAKLYPREHKNGKHKGYQWDISFSYPKEKEPQLSYYYAYATVNAKTGKIISYNVDIPYDMKSKTVKPKYTKAEAVKQMETFFSMQVPEYFELCVSSDTNDDGNMQNDMLIDYRGDLDIFQYNRVYKNIQYSENRLYGDMDTETGRILDFYYEWDDEAIFEDPENRISEQAAEDAYLSYDSIPLIYEINWENNKPIVRLVYSTMIQPFYVSPFNGNQLSYDGTEYTPQETRFKYQDIGSSSAKESIEILADLGLGFSGGLFYPKKAITVEEWKSLEGNILTSYENNEILKKWDVWNNEKRTVTRLDAAKYCVIASGLNKAAVLPDTYQITYKDRDKIPEADAGYVMLARGLKLVTGDSENNFNPDAPVTREEAAQIIMNLIKQR